MRLYSAMILGGLAAILPTSIQAAPERYNCEISRTTSSGNWFPPRLVVEYDRTSDEARVALPFTEGWTWVPAQIDRVTAQQFVVTYSQTVRDRANQNATMDFRLVYRFGNQRLNVSATPRGYANSFSVRGACAPA